MACSSCGNRKKKIIHAGVSLATQKGYTEGQDGYTEIMYTGESILKIRGRFTGNHYLFGGNAKRRIDSNDAQCLLSRSDFYAIESGDSGAGEDSKDSPQRDLGGNERVSRVVDQRLQEHGEGLETET